MSIFQKFNLIVSPTDLAMHQIMTLYNDNNYNCYLKLSKNLLSISKYADGLEFIVPIQIVNRKNSLHRMIINVAEHRLADSMQNIVNPRVHDLANPH